MSSDIQFGDLEQSEPQRALRPDQDGHFLVAEIGELRPGELKIYVDLDVMRDMEAHAKSNTKVELGGVMLGQQHVDDEGVPFVVVTDSLRARHYEATKGSFKFTHDTWSQITDERAEFRPDLEMVGWYHTHPGWSVFLSGMDLFICNNFFNRPLDVALVIDPCEDDRGWFQWSNDSNPATFRTGGFLLTTGRYREQELNHFVRMYNKEPIMNQDPRYSPSGFGGASQPVVNLMESRKPLFEIAIVTMLMMQFLLFSIVAWKILTPNTASIATQDQQKLQAELDSIRASQIQQTRNQTYQEVLQSLVTAQTGENSLVEDMTNLRTANQQMQSNINAQMAYAEKLTNEKGLFENELQAKNETLEKLSLQLAETRNKLDAAKTKVASLTNSAATGGATGSPEDLEAADSGLAWWWLPVVGLATALLGGYFGMLFQQKQMMLDEFEDSKNLSDTPSVFGTQAETRDEDENESQSADVTVKIVDGVMEGSAPDPPPRSSK